MQNFFNPPFNGIRTIHFVGIGGIGMSGIAEVMHGLGYTIQGSDMGENTNVGRLISLGIKVTIGHSAENIKNADILVISSAILPNNEEYQAALNAKIPVLKRGKMLAELMRFKWGIAVAGTHGKTTTTSLISFLLNYANLNPTAIIGGIVNSWENNILMGESNWMVAEADESDGSFLELPAVISLVTNIEAEHLDHFKDYNYVKDSFIRFVHNIPFYGFSVVCIDDDGVKSILPNIIERRIITYGTSPQSDYRAINIEYVFGGVKFDIECTYKEKEKTIKNMILPMYGQHNILNALAAVVVADNLDIGLEIIREGLQRFPGVKRRFTKVGHHNDVTFIDDYAHHPSEIEAVLRASRHFTKEGKIISVIQPHRYTRLQAHFEQFCNCFNDSDYVFILDVYSAGESAIDGVNAKSLVDCITKHGHKNVSYIPDKKMLYNIVRNVTTAKDLVVFMGAGDITYFANTFVNNLEKI